MSFLSNATQKPHEMKNHSRENISCHSQNFIYLLTCKTCNIQYVRETALPLHKRINIYRKAKSGCKHMIKHFRNDCVGSSLIMRILEIFKRLKRGDYWMKKLRTTYRYGLNERAINITVTYHLENYYFLYLKISKDQPDVETTIIT